MRIAFERSFASTPYAYLWSDINVLQADEVAQFSHQYCAFLCNICNHLFDSQVYNVTAGKICPYCSSKQLCDSYCITCHEKSFASSKNAHLWSDQNKIDVHMAFKRSSKKYLFTCPKCPHIHEAPAIRVDNGQSCLYCSGNLICGKKKCNRCKENSFASNPKSKCFSKKNGVDPITLFKSQNKPKYYFDCDECSHTFQATLNSVDGGSFCPYCASQKRCNKENCEHCKGNSFASHTMSELWSPKNEVSARMVARCSETPYHFDCTKCNHKFDMSPHTAKDFAGCPYCVSIWLCEKDDCDHCTRKSFKSQPTHIYWSKENEVTPRMVLKKTNTKYKFDCPHCNKIYIASPCNIYLGKWCKCTTHKTEAKLYKFLTSEYPDLIITPDEKFDWCKNINHLPFDFFIEKYNLIIELDGDHHFRQVRTWKKSGDEAQKWDIYKMKLANEHNYSVIRIYQEDVWQDKNKWQKKLQKVIKKYDNPINIFIGDIYSSHPKYKSHY